ncbi:hypothetical protein CP8484711_1005, partial [Chlamydia psittaci 84-8471/1]
YAQA